ncbi:hypothetical protein [Magnetofaba australis]|nr:hypothetical protein [Magnetofaba australis]
MRGLRRKLLLILALLWPMPAQADAPRIVDAQASRLDTGAWRFDVTVRHADSGWDHFADGWEILATDKTTVLARRTLYHPHVNEQPFTRSLSPVQLDKEVSQIFIRVHDKRHGYGEALYSLTLPKTPPSE